MGEKDDPDLLQNRPPIQRALVISAGVLANVRLTLILSIGTASTVGLGAFCATLYVCMFVCMYLSVCSLI